MATARHMLLHGNAKVEREIVETVPEQFKVLLACVMFLTKLLKGEYVRVEALPHSAYRVLMSEEAGRIGRIVELTANSATLPASVKEESGSGDGVEADFVKVNWLFVQCSSLPYEERACKIQ
ncbi:hypothetical protein MPER_07507, partial [Moniliophthora perniciosa FA553]